jgi:hypothetical protein
MSSVSQPLSAAKARDLVRKAALADVLEAALDALRDAGETGLRELVLERYKQLAANPVRLDGGAHLRTVLLQALRPIARAEDVAVFEEAVLVVEIGYGKDVAQNLRAAALLGISSLDEPLAAWYAARLLDDRTNVSEVTGQPALTAVQLLAAIGRPELLYLETLRGGGHPEVRAECARQLTGLPPHLLRELAASVLASGDEARVIGFIDLALAHEALAEVLPDLRAWMAATDKLDVYGFFVSAAVASRRDEALQLLRDERGRTTDRQKFTFLEGALELA